MYSHNKKTGYLDCEHKFFYLKDIPNKPYDIHYHDFYKLLILTNGSIDYYIEGKTYHLQPYDIILIKPGELHRPILNESDTYERIIIYISASFFYDHIDSQLDKCFINSFFSGSNIIKTKNLTDELIHSFYFNDITSNLFRKIKLIELLIYIQRSFQQNMEYISSSSWSNKVVINIIDFINNNITSNLTIDSIAKHVYLNKTYIMHLFKDETGQTIGKYITEKRLFLARQLIYNGTSITEACFKSGFNKYNTFYHAYKNKYNSSPREIFNDSN